MRQGESNKFGTFRNLPGTPSWLHGHSGDVKAAHTEVFKDSKVLLP